LEDRVARGEEIRKTDAELKSPYDVLQMDAQGALIREKWAVVDRLRTGR